MMTASKALIGFCVLAVAGTVLVIGPEGLRRLLPGAPQSEVASATKQQSNVAAKVEPKVDPSFVAKVEPKVEAKAEPKVEPKVEPKAEPAPVPETGSKSASKSLESKPAGSAQTASSAPPAASDALDQTRQATAALPDPAPQQAPPATGATGPRFDVARVDPDGVAVIAGQAAPGAKVELQRGAETLDTAVADGAGQFVMTPQKLPSGQYQLTLRAKAPDGTVTQSSQSVPVALSEAAPAPPRLAAASKDAVEVKPKAEAKQETETAILSANAAAPSAPAADAPTGALAPHVMNRQVIRGDSLWAISRRAYGDGARYARIFNANRDKIHNPDLIYPGQTFVLPKQ